MNKTPIAAGLAMIMGISVVFAFDRVKPIDGMSNNMPDTAVQVSAPEVIISAQPGAGIEANIMLEEAPLILEAVSEKQFTDDGLVSGQAAAEEKTSKSNGKRSLKLALLEMQQALELREREAELTHRAVASIEQKSRQ